LLEHALAGGVGRGHGAVEGGPPSACRVRVPSEGDAATALSALRQVCGEHGGAVPLFVHVVVASLEVVVRAAGVSVDASAELVGKIETLLGPGTVTVEHAGRA